MKLLKFDLQLFKAAPKPGAKCSECGKPWDNGEDHGHGGGYGCQDGIDFRARWENYDPRYEGWADRP